MKLRCFLFIIGIPITIFSQNGNSSFEFVNTDFSSRSIAMGGSLISIYDNDISIAQTVPSILNNSMDNKIGFNFIDYFSDIKMVSFDFSKSINNIVCMSLGFSSIDYGEFQRTNEIGEQQSTFSASDQIFSLGIGRLLMQNLSFGVNLKFLNSNYDSYSSYALSSNVSSTYFNNDKTFTTTLLLKNIGKQISSFSSVKEYIPFEIQFGLSKKLEHLPFRYSIVLQHLNRYDISNDYSLNSFTNNDTGEIELQQESIAKTLLRHIVIGGELNLFKENFFVRGGFDFQRRFDLTIDSYSGMVGFSFGIGINVSKVKFSYSRSSYHLSGNLNTFSINTNLSNFGI
jgi:hypothetical protein